MGFLTVTSGQEHAKHFVRAASPALFIVMCCVVVMHHAQGQMMTLMTMTTPGEREECFLFGFSTGFPTCICLARPVRLQMSYPRNRGTLACADKVRDGVALRFTTFMSFCYLQTIKSLSLPEQCMQCCGTKLSFCGENSLSAALKRNYMADIFGIAKDWVLQEPIWSKLNYF